ncbi:type III pantothenate kinase [Limibacillus sp. MBR-115]|jgi:type III pantothenate kinase|uniref:type III pantothenate kinase n=1 Tax=Limibacillus sp. MBR-115 TaxID=3156465 RepID=UPI003394F27E
MLLAIDSGNTNVGFAIYDGDRRCGYWRASSQANRTADEYAVWLTQLMQLDGLASQDISAAIIANVVPPANYALISLCRRYFRVQPLMVGQPDVKIGVPIRVDRPEQVGVDRLVNCVAAQERYGGPLIVIDFGTATTFDIVGPDGAYEGGVIAPGINLSIDALYRAAAQLPRIVVDKPATVIGKATVPAMKSGVFWGYIGLIEGLVARIQTEYGQPMKVISTGGLAPLFSEATDAIGMVDGDLTLRGLQLIHALNNN